MQQNMMAANRKPHKHLAGTKPRFGIGKVSPRKAAFCFGFSRAFHPVLSVNGVWSDSSRPLPVTWQGVAVAFI